jgi:redox-sensing transcriptional repressor
MQMQNVTLVGLDHLGRAVLDYFQGRRPKLPIAAVFDTNRCKINWVINGCRCYHTDEIKKVIKENNIIVGILSVPVEDAQEIADPMVNVGMEPILSLFGYIREEI